MSERSQSDQGGKRGDQPRPGPDPILRHLMAGDIGQAMFSDDPACAPEQVSAWVDQKSNRRVLENLTIAMDMQSEFFLARFQNTVAARLAEVAMSADHPVETTRKSCVDFMKLAQTSRQVRSRRARRGDDH